LSTTDQANYTFTRLSTDKTVASMSVGTYADYALNATGTAQINQTGISKFGYAMVYDIDGTTPPSGGDLGCRLHIRMADYSGSASDPKLVVEHTAGGGGGGDGYAFASTTLQDLNYTYDAVGNITKLIDRSGTKSAATTTYTYDGLYRLTRASTTGATTTNWMETYAYDALGNITSKSDVGSYTYSGTGYANPHAVTTAGGTSYGYDNAGNLISKGSMTLAWDPWNRLKYTSLSGTTTGYTYDHVGQRVTQGVNRGSGTTTTTYFNQYFEKTGATTTLYVYALGQLLATVEGNGSATSTHIAHTDHLSGTNVMSDKTGNLAQLATYYPFGSKRNNELPTLGANERQYIGQYYDDTVALSYLNARYYDGTRGQFVSQDPILVGAPNKKLLTNPQALNMYAYALGNPINDSDPSGLLSLQQQNALNAVYTAFAPVTEAQKQAFANLTSAFSSAGQAVYNYLVTDPINSAKSDLKTMTSGGGFSLQGVSAPISIAANIFANISPAGKGTTLGKEALKESIDWAVENRLKHVFGKAERAEFLEPVIKKLGSSEEVLSQAIKSANGRFVEGINEIPILMEGARMKVVGMFSEGVFKLGSIYIR